MIAPGTVALVALAYLGLLFGVAAWAGRRGARGESLLRHPSVYALALAVYCTGWTFFGSVGRASTSGVGFLPIYLGPTLTALLWGAVVRKLIRVSRYHRVTSLADLAAARYGKSALVGGVVAVGATLAVVPYIALQLKAVAAGVGALTGTGAPAAALPVAADAAFWIAVGLAVFTVAFGARHLDAAERHDGLVTAVAFEAVVKLVAFLVLGAVVTFGLYGGVGDLFGEAAARPELAALLAFPEGEGVYLEWAVITGLSALAIVLLPRQFHVAVVENTDERHLERAAWLFPLYLLAINLFVLPIALAGRLRLPAGADADLFVLTLPLTEGMPLLALVVFVGGLSAATSMVIVAATALATMLSNNLAVPLLLRGGALDEAEASPGRLVLGLRRALVVAVVLAGYAYYRLIGAWYPLVSIGLISFAGVAQFAPAVLGGLYWTRGNRAGALAGLVGGLLVWAYVLPLPTLVEAGVLAPTLVTEGPWGVGVLRPHALLGLGALSPLPHAVFWSLLVNVGLYVGVSLWTRADPVEQAQALAFVHIDRYVGSGAGRSAWRGTAAVADLQALLARFLGRRRAERAVGAYVEAHPPAAGADGQADAAFVHHVETLLAGALGSASARVVVARAVTEEPVPLGEVLDVLDEAQQARAYGRALEQKSQELAHQRRQLEATTRELRTANERLRDLDRLRDEFVSTVSHELRTPLTSIRAMAEILEAHPDLPTDQRQEFLTTVVRESERLTRLIEGVLTLQRPGAGDGEAALVDLGAVVDAAVQTVRPDAAARSIRVVWERPRPAPRVRGDGDALAQVALNLLSNAVKFTDGTGTRVAVDLSAHDGEARLAVTDDGPGVHPDDRERIFEAFERSDRGPRRPGSGLGLAIVRRIVRAHGGAVAVEAAAPAGARFTVRLPLVPWPPSSSSTTSRPSPSRSSS